MSSAKVQKAHLERLALIYVRQSTFVQVIKNRESGLRQYDLALRARELGWREDQVVVIDEDQGHSGASTHDRSGFGRIMGEVGLGQGRDRTCNRSFAVGAQQRRLATPDLVLQSDRHLARRSGRHLRPLAAR